MFRFAVIAAALCAGLVVLPARAHEFTVGSLKIGHPWARATPRGASVGVGYVKITNTGTAPDRLLGGSTDAARNLEFHSMKMEGDVMKMRPVTGGIEIKPGQTVELKPGGQHVMFKGLTHPLKKGERVQAILAFEKAGKVAVDFVIQGMGAKSGGGGHEGAHSAPGMPMNH